MMIRRAKSSDAIELVRLHRDTIRKVNSKDYTAKEIEAWANNYTIKKFRNEKNIRFVAIDKNKLLGSAAFDKKGYFGLYVHKDYIGKGIGSKLLRKIEETAYKKGIRKFNPIVVITAKKFYEKHGYKTIKRIKYSIKSQKLTVYQMKKKLKKYI